ncbi:MAG: glucosyl-3-phosphoglycerate phosphatase [Frankiaceae bacterium]|jgi:probable phosphoglycerate mutase|nr:glucosyl-3-phosphoglycerate phosphatase [Frankiaceae bacterium]
MSSRFQGRLDSPLVPDGLDEIAAAAAYLATLSPVTLATSPAPRAIATASYLQKLVVIDSVIDDGLDEVSLGVWEGLTHDEVRDGFPEEYRSWRIGADVRRGGGETYVEVGQRVRDALARLVARTPAGGTAVAVTHAGTSRAAIGTLLDLPVEAWPRLGPVGNVRWSVLVESERGWRLAEHNAGVLEPFSGLVNSADTEPVDSRESR